MNTHRYIARIIVEAKTPLFVGSGESSLLKDALVQKDFNGLPMIPGTALAGVLKHAIMNRLDSETKKIWDDLLGYQVGNKGLGSRLRISSAYMMLNESMVAEGIQGRIDDNIRLKFDNLPSRQHVKIDHKGVALKGGLFDNEVVYKGTRFKFELELIGNETDNEQWNTILKAFKHPLFRIGQGTRNGYGKLAVSSIKFKIFNLTDEQCFNAYSAFDASLNNVSCFEETDISGGQNDLIHYKLDLDPDEGFFIFSEGYGDADVDNKHLEEEVIEYKEGTIVFVSQTVIPASSIKGALSHRTAFHYNKIKKRWAENLSTTDIKARECQIKLWTSNFNEAVEALFGSEAGHEKNQPRRGNVILDDVYFTDAQVENTKILNHVAIDRFTGGAINSALFSEKVSQFKNDTKLTLNIYVDNEKEEEIVNAFEGALIDIAKGLLPLGGMTTKGMGIFTGSVWKNDVLLFDYKEIIEENGN